MKKVLITMIIFLSPMFALAEDRMARALVSATEKVSISSEISARVEKINFLLGDAFKKGDILISFDCELYKAQNEVIKANYETAKIQLENDKQLLEMRSIGKLQYQHHYCDYLNLLFMSASLTCFRSQVDTIPYVVSVVD